MHLDVVAATLADFCRDASHKSLLSEYCFAALNPHQTAEQRDARCQTCVGRRALFLVLSGSVVRIASAVLAPLLLLLKFLASTIVPRRDLESLCALPRNGNMNASTPQREAQCRRTLTSRPEPCKSSYSMTASQCWCQAVPDAVHFVSSYGRELWQMHDSSVWLPAFRSLCTQSVRSTGLYAGSISVWSRIGCRSSGLH